MGYILVGFSTGVLVGLIIFTMGERYRKNKGVEDK